MMLTLHKISPTVSSVGFGREVLPPGRRHTAPRVPLHEPAASRGGAGSPVGRAQERPWVPVPFRARPQVMARHVN
jgi:hypothetical protein